MSRATNERVAVEVFGEECPPERPVVTGQISTVTMLEAYPWKAWVPEYGDRDGWAWAPRPFDSEIADAWLVVEKMRKLGWTVWVNVSGDEEFASCRMYLTVPYEDERTKGKNLRVVDKASVVIEYADIAPEAICQAALAALSQGDA